MTFRYSLMLGLAIFIAGTGTGWFAKSWLVSNQIKINDGLTISTHLPFGSTTHDNDLNRTEPPEEQQVFQSLNSEEPAGKVSDESIEKLFTELLSRQQYFDAVNLYQEQIQKNRPIAAEMKLELFNELERLIEIRDNTGFSSLIDNYLSAYYDDIDALLLLADFNETNGSYLEVVDVYLLAKTYAYNEADQERVTKRFNQFVEKIDSLYTTQTNWWSLVNFYSHINTSGLMTSVHQYRLALAHLGNGDKEFAISLFKELRSDSLMGDSAAQALADITGISNTQVSPVIVSTSVWDGAESIALEKFGNQFSIDLSNNQRNSVNLLIDTGASMTAMSNASFDTLNANNDAVRLEQRVFRTAGGLVQGTVYSVPELVLGPYILTETKIAVIEFGTERKIDGLLGMNILGQFRFLIDQDNSRLLLLSK